MAATVYITVEDITARLAAGYTRIELERAPAVGGTYVNVANITLVALDYEYSFVDSSGTLSSWYRYRFSDAAALLSDYSNPFQPSSITLLKLRQYVLNEYGIGHVMLAGATPGDSNTIITDDWRYKTTLYSVGRGAGGFIKVTSGARAGQVSNVLGTSSPTTGSFELSPALTGALTAGDEFEWHWLVAPDVLDRTINRGLRRYWYLDRFPITGDGDTDEYTLSHIPWLQQKHWITGVFYYANEGLDVNSNLDRSWENDGRWLETRQDGGVIRLTLHPRLGDGDVVYIEATRRMPELFTDASQLPLGADIELCAALAWDELLQVLKRPVHGSSDDRKVFAIAREDHKAKLMGLLRLHRIQPKFTRPQGQSPINYAPPYSAR